jgi:hypothetical protein
MFQRLDSVSLFRWNLLSLTQLIELVPIYGQLHQHKKGHANKAQHKPCAWVKTNIKNFKNTPQVWGLIPGTIRTDGITREIKSLCCTHVTNFMGLSPSWEAANCAGTPELSNILWSPKVQCRVRKSPPPLLILSQINAVDTIPF